MSESCLIDWNKVSKETKDIWFNRWLEEYDETSEFNMKPWVESIMTYDSDDNTFWYYECRDGITRQVFCNLYAEDYTEI